MQIKRLLTSLVLGLGMALVFLGLLIAGPMTQVHADTYTVTNINASGPGSLRQAILDANSNPGPDVITFNPGVTGDIVLADALPVIADDLTISGPGAEQLGISGANTYRVFSITTGIGVTITEVTVRDGNAVDSEGGGIWSAGSLYLDSVQIVNNTASGSWPSGKGGGVYVNEGSATLSGTQVLNNSTTNRGGGVFVNAGSVTLNGTQVLNNSASYGGGGVYVNEISATLKVSGGVISSNSANSGGGVDVWSGSATLSGTQVVNNLAFFYGGGVYVFWGNATLSETQVANNSASYSGGGVFVERGSATLNRTQVVNNSASDDGGGVCVWNGSATLNETQVLNNSATNRGGGVFISEGWEGSNATLSVSGGEINSNSASKGGGAYVDKGSVTLNGTQVYSNSASYGGGVYVFDGSAMLNVSGGEINSNLASSSAGGVYVSQGSAALNGTKVVSNSASNDGGGVFVYQGGATLNETQVAGNLASDGGGVYLYRNGAITATNGCFVSNSDTAVDRIDGTLIATDNWWGAADGPGGAGPGSGDTVSAGVDYANFKTVLPPACLFHSPGYDSTPAPGSSISVGLIEVGGAISTTLTINETGDMPLVVTPTLSGPDTADFGVTLSTLTIPDGGTAQDLTISCRPSFTGTLGTLSIRLAVTLTVAHNAPDSPAVYSLRCTSGTLRYVYLPLLLRNK